MDPGRRERKKQMADINVVPYIDVMLVLLVIFMVTMPLLQKNVRVELPKVTMKKKKFRHSTKPIILNVDRNGNATFNFGPDPNAFLDYKQLKARAEKLININPNVEVMVKGHENVRYEMVIKPIAALQAAGIKRLNLVMEFDDPRL